MICDNHYFKNKQENVYCEYKLFVINISSANKYLHKSTFIAMFLFSIPHVYYSMIASCHCLLFCPPLRPCCLLMCLVLFIVLGHNTTSKFQHDVAVHIFVMESGFKSRDIRRVTRYLKGLAQGCDRAAVFFIGKEGEQSHLARCCRQSQSW